MKLAVKGVYFQWTNEPVAPAIKEWNVLEMRVSESSVEENASSDLP